jgi:hypothetical protein
MAIATWMQSGKLLQDDDSDKAPQCARNLRLRNARENQRDIDDNLLTEVGFLAANRTLAFGFSQSG